MKRRDPTTEELELWRRAMRNTTPLPGRSRPHGAGETTEPRPEKPACPTESRTPGSEFRAGAPTAVNADKNRTVLTTGGLDAATQRRLRRGRVNIEARVDLHGLRQSEAFHVLTRFLADSQAAGRRCVLVITGKGGRLPETGDAAFMRRAEDGVLRRHLPLWLAREPNASKVFAMEQAHSRHGGSGAYYVFLRKPQGGS